MIFTKTPKTKPTPQEKAANDLILDAQQELARERNQKIMRAIAPFAVAGVIALVGGTAAFSLYQGHINSKQEQAGALFYPLFQNVQQKQQLDTAQLEAIRAITPTGYGSLAALQQASALAQQGNWQEAVKAYDAIAKDTAHDAALRDFAALQAAQLLIKQDATQFATQITERLKPLSEEGKPWALAALEAQAMLALTQNKTAEARAALTTLSQSADAPETMRARAETLLLGLPAVATTKVKTDGNS